ncbi:MULTISPECIES: hypothetical protein [Streptomycetaceae]|uniref:Uncharacterized protein n=1 Tax=Streptantibioticus cattleyicolor (strain ATCC 35852 / DSM 46488 / JCM 4925 / NBRC 14057 / NRRL 8057) TaxID=1003195 RepID=F8JXV8_STREN|nr:MULTISPECIES: hypothetical protein [Streptomycetaceae]AEW93655.1 hypothetical protein SCATT_12840 [Streptantibioticus cattleyicolor NRRL 8057 = DSM 46488]MYS58357.1 hypothetical protein [Streptomyces sp. SID5468]CCB74005.1 protein of unknown function [Streptantibioticus cattleyicolor NRRL 8057 = DSM 46488]
MAVRDDQQSVEFPGYPGVGRGAEGSAAELIDDCRRTAARWTKAPRAAERAAVSPAQIHGTRVPDASADAVRAMSDYGG